MRAAYRVLLEREADVDGLAHWTNRVAAGLSPVNLLRAFVDSDEFQYGLIYNRDSFQPKRDLVLQLETNNNDET